MAQDVSVAEAAEPDDPAAPVFFVSYWRPDPPASGAGPPREANRFVRRFFDDLTEDVDNLIGSLPGRHPGFLDVVRGGELWEKRLLHAAGTCQVFVSLLSGPYLAGSAWCAREWDLFSRRRVVPRPGRAEPTGHDASAIVPVLWAPPAGPLPPAVADVPLFVPGRLRDDFRADYRAEGLLGLLRTGKEPIYQAVVWRIAQHVERIRRHHRVEPLHLPGPAGLRTTFERGGR
ncbi:hypothetical protein [Actinoplanes sp. M2I2]|uniref:hypothetical protein n=1 Tax=Actinoplanes sp. M2I2 TaxID=1734444 RepID=UPI002020AE78|nr:hypothetical protein [Actinoplanes sp. M2I2]